MLTMITKVKKCDEAIIIKLEFLGLKTLGILKRIIGNIKMGFFARDFDHLKSILTF